MASFDEIAEIEKKMAQTLADEIDKEILKDIMTTVDKEKRKEAYEALDEIDKLMVQAGYEVKGCTKTDLQE